MDMHEDLTIYRYLPVPKFDMKKKPEMLDAAKPPLEIPNCVHQTSFKVSTYKFQYVLNLFKLLSPKRFG